jgi:phage terminase large subunit
MYRPGAVARTHDPEARLVVALDMARLGADKSVLGFRRGAVLEEVVSRHGATTTETATRVIDELRQRGIHQDLEPVMGYSALLGHIVTHSGPLVRVDEIGVGSGPLDQLRSQGVRVESFNGSRAPVGRGDSYPYLNRRAEAFFGLRGALEAGAIALPRDNDLAGELVSLRWRVSSQGKLALEPKEDLKSRLGRSCDKADAVSMCFFGFTPKRPTAREAVRW